MDNTLAAELAMLSTAQLLNLLQAREQYEPEITLAVIAELENRNVPVPDLEDIKQYAQAVYEAKLEQENQPKTIAEKVKNFLQVFVPQPGYYITPILLNINLFVFIVMVLVGISFISPQAGQLFAVGGNYGPYTMSGQWWRLLTSMFIHAGILHLLLNMLALVSVGRQLEVMLGRVPFLISYLLCGLSGSLVSTWWDGTRVGVGASGAIFGMFGLLLVVMALEQKLSWKDKRAMLGNLGFVIAINLGFGMTDGIDNAAHAGGLVAGLILGAVLMLRSKRLVTANYSSSGNAIMAGVGFVLLIVAYNLIPFNGQLRYLYTMDQVVQKETIALQTLQQISEVGENASASEFVPKVEAGIKLWDESEVMLEEIEDMNGKEKDRVLVMLDYVRLRKKSYEMLRDDLQNNRELLNPKQQQILWAIDGYVNALREGRESEVVDKSLSDASALPQNEAEATGNTLGIDNPPGKVLLVVDGVKVGLLGEGNMPAQVAGIEEKDIDNITILKDKQALEVFGAEAANGAVVIKTK
jgi:rhomboid protease GluP